MSNYDQIVVWFLFRVVESTYLFSLIQFLHISNRHLGITPRNALYPKYLVVTMVNGLLLDDNSKGALKALFSRYSPPPHTVQFITFQQRRPIYRKIKHLLNGIGKKLSALPPKG